MALFRIAKGKAVSLPTNKAEGSCYITTDTKRMYIDIDNSNRIELAYLPLTGGTVTGATTFNSTITVGAHVQLAYDSTNKCLNFNFI